MKICQDVVTQELILVSLYDFQLLPGKKKVSVTPDFEVLLLYSNKMNRDSFKKLAFYSRNIKPVGFFFKNLKSV